jgi:glycosyltransferase involved in cell wall biosynthesis
MIGPVGHGIAEYVRDLVLGLYDLPEKNFEVHLLIGKELPKDDLICKVPHTLVHSRFLSFSEMFEVPRVLKKLKANLFHSPSFSAYPFMSIPTIYTVHDLNHLHFGSSLQKAYYEFILKSALRRAVQVCTVSEFSRGELAKWLGWPKERIQVVKNAIHVEDPPRDSEERLKKWGLTKHKYHFSLSSNKPHKNMPFLVRAYLAHAEATPSAWPLVISLTQEEAGLEHPKLICVGRLNSQDKNTLLANAGAFYFPSLYEGFGRPPLEAAAFGVPVVVSDISVHAEILSEVQEKILVPLADAAQWKGMFTAQEEQKERRAAGFYFSQSREGIASEVAQIYNVFFRMVLVNSS